jgi:hypothetical protein
MKIHRKIEDRYRPSRPKSASPVCCTDWVHMLGWTSRSPTVRNPALAHGPNEYALIDRETACLAFSDRIHKEAADPNVPLFERLLFYRIFSSNLDEYFQLHVASVRRLLRLGKGDTARLQIEGWQV